MKRQRTTDPLTADDVADRLNRAATRTLAILMEARDLPGLFDAVKRSRYLVQLGPLRDELVRWWPQDAAPSALYADVARSAHPPVPEGWADRVEDAAEALAAAAGSTAFDPHLPDDPARQPARDEFRRLAAAALQVDR